MEHNGRLKVKFDFSFFAVVAFMIFVDTSGAAVLSLIACILHEGGHLLAMAVCGAYPERITFYGGGIALTRTGMDCLPDGKRDIVGGVRGEPDSRVVLSFYAGQRHGGGLLCGEPYNLPVQCSADRVL